MGVIPIAIGIKNLVEIRKKDKYASRQVVQDKKNRSSLSFLAVAAVTFSNGGDNIGVYVPLFSKYNAVSQISGLTVVFLVMTAVWCIAAYYLMNHPLVASRIRHVGNIILPFVLIGLGIYILIESFLLTQDKYTTKVNQMENLNIVSQIGLFNETIFDRTLYGDKSNTTSRKWRWLQDLKQQRKKDIKTEMI